MSLIWYILFTVHTKAHTFLQNMNNSKDEWFKRKLTYELTEKFKCLIIHVDSSLTIHLTRAYYTLQPLLISMKIVQNEL